MSDAVNRWMKHSKMTDPGELVSLFETLPADVLELCGIAQGILIHIGWFSAYRMIVEGKPTRKTLPVSRRLEQICAQ